MTRRLLELAAMLMPFVGRLAGCGGTGPTPVPSSSSSDSGRGPSASPRPAPTANPCVTAVAHLTAFANQLAAEIVVARPKVLDSAFDSGGSASIIARVSG